MTEGETCQNEFTFDLIIGADGVGSVVRKHMTEQFDEVKATRITGEEYARTFYLDKPEALKDFSPNLLYFSNMTGNMTVHTTLKFTDNKEGCGIMNVSRDFKDKEDARALFKKVNPQLLAAMSEENLEIFADNKRKQNVAKQCKLT